MTTHNTVPHDEREILNTLFQRVEARIKDDVEPQHREEVWDKLRDMWLQVNPEQATDETIESVLPDVEVYLIRIENMFPDFMEKIKTRRHEFTFHQQASGGVA